MSIVSFDESVETCQSQVPRRYSRSHKGSVKECLLGKPDTRKKIEIEGTLDNGLGCIGRFKNRVEFKTEMAKELDKEKKEVDKTTTFGTGCLIKDLGDNKLLGVSCAHNFIID